MVNRIEELKRHNLFDELIALRDRQREWRKDARTLIKGKDVPVELNRWGLIQWYLHPSVTYTANRTMLVWVMHIPPGSHSGKLKCQGGHIYFVWRGGRGHTVLDGVRHDWAQGCVINIPLRPQGVVFQHFNDGAETVMLVGAEENLVDSLTVDKGPGYEILEPCPQWSDAQRNRGGTA